MQPAVLDLDSLGDRKRRCAAVTGMELGMPFPLLEECLPGIRLVLERIPDNIKWVLRQPLRVLSQRGKALAQGEEARGWALLACLLRLFILVVYLTEDRVPHVATGAGYTG